MEELAKEFGAYTDHLYSYWKANSLWTFRWWLAVVLSVAPWILWLFIRQKSSTWRLLCAAFLVGIIAATFDTAGIVAGLWSHPVKTLPFPLFSCLFPWDFSVIPVSVMLVLQWLPKANPFLKAAVYAIAAALNVHPLALWLGFVHEKSWVILTMFPFFFLLYLAAHTAAKSLNDKAV